MPNLSVSIKKLEKGVAMRRMWFTHLKHTVISSTCIISNIIFSHARSLWSYIFVVFIIYALLVHAHITMVILIKNRSHTTNSTELTRINFRVRRCTPYARRRAITFGFPQQTYRDVSRRNPPPRVQHRRGWSRIVSWGCSVLYTPGGIYNMCGVYTCVYAVICCSSAPMRCVC